MKPDSWEFLLGSKKDAFTDPNWHSIELRLLRRKEVGELYQRHGGEEASRILKEKKELIDERNKVWLRNQNIKGKNKEIANASTNAYGTTNY